MTEELWKSAPGLGNGSTWPQKELEMQSALKLHLQELDLLLLTNHTTSCTMVMGDKGLHRTVCWTRTGRPRHDTWLWKMKLIRTVVMMHQGFSWKGSRSTNPRGRRRGEEGRGRTEDGGTKKKMTRRALLQKRPVCPSTQVSYNAFGFRPCRR